MCNNKIIFQESCGNCEVEYLDDECSLEPARCNKCNNFSEWVVSKFLFQQDHMDNILCSDSKLSCVNSCDHDSVASCNTCTKFKHTIFYKLVKEIECSKPSFLI